jgi:hypothetical protein
VWLFLPVFGAVDDPDVIGLSKKTSKNPKCVLTLREVGGIHRSTLRRRIAERLNDFFSCLELSS